MATRVTTTISNEVREYCKKNGVKLSFLIFKGFETIKSGASFEAINKQLAADLKHQEELRERWQMLYNEKMKECEFIKGKYGELSLELEQLKEATHAIKLQEGEKNEG